MQTRPIELKTRTIILSSSNCFQHLTPAMGLDRGQRCPWPRWCHRGPSCRPLTQKPRNARRPRSRPNRTQRLPGCHRRRPRRAWWCRRRLPAWRERRLRLRGDHPTPFDLHFWREGVGWVRRQCQEQRGKYNQTGCSPSRHYVLPPMIVKKGVAGTFAWYLKALSGLTHCPSQAEDSESSPLSLPGALVTDPPLHLSAPGPGRWHLVESIVEPSTSEF